MKYLHTGGAQGYRWYICQYDSTVTCQAIEGRWYVVSCADRNFYSRCLQGSDDVLPFAWFSFDNQDMRRSLDIDECSGFIVGKNGILRRFQSDAIGVKARRRS